MSANSSSWASRNAQVSSLGKAETPIFTDGFEAIPITIINVDPPLVQKVSGVSAQVHVNNLSSVPQSVTIHRPGEVEIEPEFQFDPAFPGGIELSIPTGLAPGDWSLEIQPMGGAAVAILDAAFTASDDISLAFDSAPSALSSAAAVATTPNCSPSSLINRTSCDLIAPLILRS